MSNVCDKCLAVNQCPNCGVDAHQKAVLLKGLRAEIRQLLNRLAERDQVIESLNKQLLNSKG